MYHEKYHPALSVLMGALRDTLQQRMEADTVHPNGSPRPYIFSRGGSQKKAKSKGKPVDFPKIGQTQC